MRFMSYRVAVLDDTGLSSRINLIGANPLGANSQERLVLRLAVLLTYENRRKLVREGLHLAEDASSGLNLPMIKREMTFVRR